MAFLSRKQLDEIGLKSFGENVLISDKARIYNPSAIRIGSNVRIDDFAILSAGEGGIYLGSYIHVGSFCGLMGAEEIRMDDFSGLSSRVFIYSSTDDYSGEALTNPMVPRIYRNVFSAKVHLAKHVIVGTCATILPGVSVGMGSAIGAYSLVVKNIPESVIAVGQPCKVLKPRKVDLLDIEKKLREESESK